MSLIKNPDGTLKLMSWQICVGQRKVGFKKMYEIIMLYILLPVRAVVCTRQEILGTWKLGVKRRRNEV